MKEARLTFQEFETVMQRWRHDVFATTPQRRIESALRTTESPLKCAKRLSEDFFIPEPPTPDQMNQMFFGGRATRKLHRYGIEFERIQYSSSALRKLFETIGESHDLSIRYDPTDVRAIGVIHPSDQTMIMVSAKDAFMPAISLSELKRIRKALAPDPEEFLSGQRVLAAIAKKFHHGDKPLGTKRKQRVKKNAQRRRDAEIIENSKTPHSATEEIEQAIGDISNDTRTMLARPKPLPQIERRSKP